MGALLRTAHARAGISEDRRAPLRHAEGPPLAGAAHHHRREDADRAHDLRRGGGSHGARITVPAPTGGRRSQLVQPVAVDSDGLRARLVDHQAHARSRKNQARIALRSPRLSRPALERRQHLAPARGKAPLLRIVLNFELNSKLKTKNSNLPRSGPLLGAQMSIAGGVDKSLLEGKKVECEAIQIFTRSSRQWAARPYEKEEIALFRQNRKDTRSEERRV